MSASVSDTILALVRHGQSTWNKKNLFTGWRDPCLTETGRQEAITAGKILAEAEYRFDVAFTSALQRAHATLDLMLDALGQTGLETIYDEALNERDYGDLSGLNKDDARMRWGEEQVHIWRRSFDVPPPGGESLEMTGERVLPYYEAAIKPRLLRGETVLVSAHGNSLRALIMGLEGLSGEAIVQREVETGVPIVYRLDASGTPHTRIDYEDGAAHETTLPESPS